MKVSLLALVLLQASPSPLENDALRAVDASWNELRLGAGVSALENLLADDWLLTHSDGRVQDKRDYLN